ncbi:MAG: hypothetical protein WBX38_09180 [Candidatus Sulfotelmatobacter sp.]
MKLRMVLLVALLTAVISLSGCGGVSMSSTTPPSNSTFTISGTVSGLTGGTVVLQDNAGGAPLTVTGNGLFSFSTPMASGSTYAVTVVTPPTGEACTVANGTGTITANVNNVSVTCAATTTPTYTIGGTISGLTSSGLVLQDNGGDNLTVVSGVNTFNFVTPIQAGDTYAVTVFTQPAGETCTVSNADGTANANVTNVAVACTTVSTPTYTIGGTVSGLTGTIVLQDNLTNNLSLTANGAFTFSAAIPSGGAYSVSVLTQPAGQNCTVSNGSGTATANVTNVAVTCVTTPTYTIGGTLSGLTGTVVLQDNLTNNLSLTANGAFTFSAAIPSGGAYSVTVLTQPTGQACAVTNGSGTATANVTNVSVVCSNVTFTIGGTLSGLTTGTVVLQDNLTNNLSLTANGSFTFTTAIPSGAAYSVTVLTQPSGQTCTVTNGSGNANANVTNVTVTCAATPTFTIGGTLSGLTTGTVVLQDNLTNNLSLTANGAFTFTTAIPSGGAYSVTVLTQPTGQTCTVTNGSGTATGNVTNVAVACAANPTFTIGGTLSGLTSGTVVLQDNLTNNLSLTANGSFTFSTAIPSGGAYSVTVLTQPTGQTCTVTNGSGTATGNVTNVAVTCTTTTLYTISAAVSGLSGTLVLQDLVSGVENPLTVTTNGTFPFSTQVPSGGTYSVTVETQPSGQSCTLGSNSGGTATGNVTVNVTCTTASATGEWTWINGPSSPNGTGIYGTKKVPASTNLPGSRYGAVTWIDASGNLWMFGGIGNADGDESVLNDLWEWNGTDWTWISGANNPDDNGVYGTLGVGAGTNIPGARAFAVSWKDTAGNFWLFGGFGFDSASTDAAGALNDLWEFTTGGQWVWMGGSDLVNPSGTYGTKGTGSTSNIPGGRYYASAYTDTSGNFWLFGGEGLDSTGSGGNPQSMNDLWEFTPSTSEWTWVSGSKTFGQGPTYGTLGKAASGNVPGAREGAVAWMDSSSDFWLFSGNGIDSTQTYGYLNDVWEFIGGDWVWQGGTNLADQGGTYGTEGTASPGNIPGGREFSSSWTTSSGENLWLFGGQEVGGDAFNDLWLLSSGQWTWVAGADFVNQAGVYGTLGTAAPANTPGARWQSATWTDNAGNLWLFGGQNNLDNVYNDLWKFVP